MKGAVMNPYGRRICLVSFAYIVASGICVAQDTTAAHSAYEPPAASAAVSLTSSTKEAPRDLLTTGEKTDWEDIVVSKDGAFTPEAASRTNKARCRASRWSERLNRSSRSSRHIVSRT